MSGSDPVIHGCVVIKCFQSELASSSDFSGYVVEIEFLIPRSIFAGTRLGAGPERLSIVFELDVRILFAPDIQILVELGTLYGQSKSAVRVWCTAGDDTVMNCASEIVTSYSCV